MVTGWIFRRLPIGLEPGQYSGHSVLIAIEGGGAGVDWVVVGEEGRSLCVSRGL
jgi:hypothetical protein